MFTLSRRISFSVKNAMSNRTKATSEEVSIPVPWGHIAGKWWGPQNQRPILCLHGWQDNCGSFDCLIPSLPSTSSFLAIDLPGHGRSSWLPEGMFYHMMNIPIMIRQLQEYFGWDKVTLIGHSLGSISTYTFGGLFPTRIDFAVCIEGMQPLMAPKGVNRMSKSIEDFLKYDRIASLKKEPPSYTPEEMAMRLHEGTRKAIDLDKAPIIMKRNATESKTYPGKFYFHIDPRVKCGPLTSYNDAEQDEAAERFSAPVCSIKAEHSGYFGNESQARRMWDILKGHNKHFRLEFVPGKHHLHLNQPDLVKQVISDFILKYDVHDRTMYKLPDDIRITNK